MKTKVLAPYGSRKKECIRELNWTELNAFIVLLLKRNSKIVQKQKLW